MEKKLIYRINKGSIFRRGGADAVSAHEEALSCVRRNIPVICRVGRRMWPHKDYYVIWYGMEKGKAVVSPMNLKKEELRRIPASELVSYVKTYWRVDVNDVNECGTH